MTQAKSRENETTKCSFRPFSQTVRRSDDNNSPDMFVPFQRERDTMGRLLSATQAASSTPKHESSHAKMNAYLMNTILVDRDIKYYGFEKRSPSNVKTRSHTSIPKKLLTKPRQTLTAPSYHPNKDFVMKRPSSAIISKEHPVNKTIIKPQRLLNGELPKKRVYSFKFSYPKSTNSYREN